MFIHVVKYHQIYACLSIFYLIEPEKVSGTLDDIDWISTMQDEFYELKRYNVWTLVPCPHGKTTDGTCQVFCNKMDEDGIITRNKERLVTQGFTQLEGLDYDETFTHVARLEVIKLFLAYEFFMIF